MRIMFIHTFYYPEIIGGAEYSVKKLSEELAKRGHDVFVLCSGSENKRETIDGVTVIRLNTFMRNATKKNNKIAKAKHYFLELYDPFDKKTILRLLDEIKPDVIHSNGLLHFSTTVWQFVKKRNIKIVHTLRDYNLCCYRANLLCDACNMPQLACKVYRAKRRRDARQVDIVTAPSNFTLKTLSEYGFFENKKMVCIPNAIDFEIKKVNRKCEEHSSKDHSVKFRFIYLGSLIEKKGVKWLLEVFKTIDDPKLELVFAGKGQLQDLIVKESNEDSRIKYLGFLNEEQINKEVYDSDVLIAPSLWNEPFGRIVLDAYKQGVPVIACRSGGLTDLVEDKTTGILINPSDDDALKAAILGVSSDEKSYIHMCNHIPMKIVEYSIEKQADKFFSLYEE